MLFSCATTRNSAGQKAGLLEEEITEIKEKIENTFDKNEPKWLMNPPIEEGYFYGLGIDESQEKARAKSIINIGQQFSSGISSVVEEITIEKDGKTENATTIINKQVTDQIVRGAKFIDEYKDAKGQYWVLSRAPLYCMLDVTEAVLIEYSLKLGAKKEEIKKLKEEYKNAVKKEEKNVLEKAKSYYKAAEKDNFILVKAGNFTMGSPESEIGRSDNERQHEVKISKDYYISKYEVTQKEYQAVMGNNPSRTSRGIGDNYPVNRVSWYNAIEYCNKLSQQDGLSPAYNIDKNTKDPNNKQEYDDLKWTVSINKGANGYRLPTEAEWEYAARGGNKTRGYIYSGSNKLDEVAWYDDISNSKVHKVGSKQANELGIYDMSGNVYEWCFDWYGAYPTDKLSLDPKGADAGWCRVCRGGSFYYLGQDCRSANRSNHGSGYMTDTLGFRVVLPSGL